MKEKKFFMRIAAAVSSAVVMLASVPAGYAMVSFAEETSAAGTESSVSETTDDAAQQETVTLSGYVIAGDTVVANADVWFDDTHSCKTDNDGKYTLENIPKADSYQVTVSRGSGYADETVTIAEDGSIRVTPYYTVSFPNDGEHIFYIVDENNQERQADNVVLQAGSVLYFRVENLTANEQLLNCDKDIFEIEGLSSKYHKVEVNSDIDIEIEVSTGDAVFQYDLEKHVITYQLPSSAKELYYANVPSNENQKVTADYVRENGSCIASGQQSGEISKLTSGYYYFCYVTADGIVSDVFPQPNALEVDVDAPKVSVDAIVTVNGKSEITFTVKDEGNEGDFVSGIDKVGLTKTGSADNIIEATKVDESGTYFAVCNESMDGYQIAAVDKYKNAVLEPISGFTMEVTYDTKNLEHDKKVNVKTSADCTVTCEGAEKTNNDKEFLIKEQGNYTIQAVDENGKLLAKTTIQVGNIDNKPPEISGLSNIGWTHTSNNSVKIMGNVSDDSHNIAEIRIEYAKVEGSEELSGDALYSEDGVNIEADGRFAITLPDEEFNGTYYIRAIDGCKNVSSPVAVEVKIDNTAPQNVSMSYELEKNKGFIKDIANGLSFGLVFKDKITIEVEASDEREKEDGTKIDSGIQKYEYKLVPENTSFEDREWKSETESTIVIPATDYPEGFQGKIYVRVLDNAGNYTTTVTDTMKDDGITVILDNKVAGAPDVFARTAGGEIYADDSWTNEDIIFTVSGGETISGVDHYEYAVNYVKDNTNWDTENADWKTVPSEDDKASITVSEDTNATYYFRAVSNAEVEGEITSIHVKVQKTIPDNAEVTLPAVNGKNDWYVSIPSISVGEPTRPQYEAQITTYYKLWNTQAGEKEPKSGMRYNPLSHPNIDDDGVYTLKVWTEDEAGNHCEKDYVKEIKVDTTAPKEQELYIVDATVAGGKKAISVEDKNSIVYRHIYQTAIEIRTAFDFDISGEEKIEYQKVRSYAVNDSKWSVYNEKTGLVVKPNEKFILAVRATDQAGNTTTIYSDGIIVDNEAPVGEGLAPEITIAPDAPNANGYHKSDVGVRISVMDPPYNGGAYNQSGIYSGLESVVYRVITDGVVTQEETLYSAKENPSDADLQPTFSTNIVVSSTLNNSNNVIVEVVAVDRAGNERVSRTADGAIQIDITAPTIRISYDNNSPDAANAKYFKDARTATIEVIERNFNPDDVRLMLTNSDGTIPAISGWSIYGGSGNGDDTVHTATLTYSADGDYTFDIAYTDMADNPCTEINYVSGTAAPQEFTIDRTAPVINVSYDNNDVKNGKYFSKGRVATIVIQEHNFDSSRVKITATASKNGKGITIPASSVSWSGSGDNHTATLNYKDDGDYTFDIQFTDMAGNESGAANYGSSAAGKEFTVDTTIEKPSVTINGKDGNGKAFQDALKLAIGFGDINYKSYDVKLERVLKGKKKEDVTKKFIQNLKVSGGSGEGIFDTFEKIQENDGIYTLTVTLTDMAENTETTEVKFTINRFGSVYEYSEYLTNLIADGGQYVKELTEDLVITEYNADKLVKDSLSIVVTKDGKPVENAQCDVTPVINDKVSTGNSGWYQYDYTIHKEDLSTDGVYKIVVSSEDEAGNTPENTNYEGQAILFRVDSTAPELTSVTGLEKPIVNAQNLTVDYDAYDTIGLKSITIYVDDKEVDKIVDFAGDANDYSGSFDIGESKNAQKVHLVVEDKAGNITDTDTDDFSSAYDFERTVTVSTNMFVRWYANKPLFWGSVGGVGVLGIGAGLLVFLKKKKKTA